MLNEYAINLLALSLGQGALIQILVTFSTHWTNNH